MPSVQPIKSVNVGGTVHPLDSVFTVLSGISTVAGSASSSSYKSVRWYVSGIEGITEPYDGMKLAIKVPLAGVATAGAVLSINGDVDANYHPLAYNINTALTTHFPVNSIKIFTYDANQTMDCYLTAKTKVTITGVWKAESNYDSNSNSIGYQVRTNTAIYKNGASTACYRYQILVETEAGLEAFTSTNNQTGTTKTQLSPKYIPNGTIRYYSSTTTVASGSNFGATVLWQQYQGIDLRYSFNVATITTNSPCYIKMSRNDDGTLSPVYGATSAGHPLVFALPTTKDGYYYTYLGRTYTSSNVVYLELELDHPTFYYDGGINIYNGKESEYALEIDVDDFDSSTGDRAFTDAEIAILKNSNKPIKLTGVTCEPDALTKDGFALLYKNIHDIGTRVEAIGGNFDDITYSTVEVMLGVLIKTGIYINCNTKVGERISIALTTNTQFNNSLPSFTEHHQYYVPSAVGNDGQFLISTGDINDPFSYSDIRTLDTTATSAQATNASEAITGSGKITLHKVSKTGNYNDLLNKPTIPTNTNQKVKAKNSGTDVTFGDNAVVEIKAGTNVQVAANATDNTITISSTDTNTTYTVATGDGNGQIKVTPSSGNAYNVDVKGLGAAAYKAVDTSVTSGSANLVTSGAVYTAINNLPEPMVFKGTLGTGGTITSLPTASSSEGYTYKVITAGTYASQSAKVGDVFVSNGSAWVLIPSGDDVEDTWRNIKVNDNELLGTGISTGAVNFKNGGNITVTGSGNNITLGVASGYSIPSTTNQTAWSAKYDKPSGGIPDSDLASTFIKKVNNSTPDSNGNVSITNLVPTCVVGSDSANTAGWYKIATSTLSGFGNQNILYFIKGGFSNGYSGILNLEMRSDRTSIRCWKCCWVARHPNLTEDRVIIVINGMTWTMYAYNDSNQYGRLYFTELSNRSIDGGNPTWSIAYFNSNTPETTEPTATVTSSDGFIVERAKKDKDGNAIDTTYLKTSGTAANSSKLNNQEASYYLNYNNLTGTPIPGDSGEIKTKYRCALKGSTGSGNPVWYYKLVKLPADNSGNYASAIINGRIGGWTASGMSAIYCLVWNRDGVGLSLLDLGGTGTMSTIFDTADLVVYKNSDNTADIYIKCKGYFTFDLDVEVYQSTATITYDGTYITTTPSGTESGKASTSTSRLELEKGVLKVNGTDIGYKILESLRKGSEADTAVGYYKIATINHVSWNFCDFCMLLKNSYAGTTYSTVLNCSCSDSNTKLQNFNLEIISGTDISNKLAYLYTFDSSNNLIKVEVFIHATRFEHPTCYIINARLGQQLVIPTEDEFNKAVPDKPDGTTMTGNATYNLALKSEVPHRVTGSWTVSTTNLRPMVDIILAHPDIKIYYQTYTSTTRTTNVASVLFNASHSEKQGIYSLSLKYLNASGSLATIGSGTIYYEYFE